MPTTNATPEPEVAAPAARRPRFRISIGAMLLAIAIAASNFAAVQRMGWPEVDWYQTESSWTVSDPSRGEFTVEAKVYRPDVGYLPFIDVVLACSAIAAMGRLRGRRGGLYMSTAVAFFGVHLTALGWIATTYLPATGEAIDAALETTLGAAMAGWLNHVGPIGGRAWDVVGGLLVAAALSGPALFLTAILTAFGAYAARTLPPARFRLTAGLTSLAFAMAGLAACLQPRPIEPHEIVDVPLVFRVVDADSGRPVEGAVVRVVDVEPADLAERLKGFEKPPTPTGATDARGSARMTVGFYGVGVRNAFTSAGDFSAWGRWLEVTAGRRRLIRPLQEVVGQVAALGGPPPRTLRLSSSEATDQPFRDLAGSYEWSIKYSSMSVDIEPDGRSRLISGGCEGDSLDAYGFLRRDGDEIELIPTPRVYPRLHGCPTRYRPVILEGRVAALEIVPSRVTDAPPTRLARRED